MQVKVINKSHHALPQYQTPQAAGLDLRANLDEPITLQPLEHRLVPTGLYMELPAGYEAQVRPRSGLAFKHGITVLNSPGTIDADYRGEIGVLLVNLSNTPFTIEDGERVAQLIVARYEQVEWQDSASLSDTERGAGGFGHSGLKCLLALLLAGLLTACGSVNTFLTTSSSASTPTTATAPVTATADTTTQTQTVRHLPERALSIFRAQSAPVPDFSAGRMSVQMGSQSVNASTRYAHERGLLMSFSLMGIEGARLEMDSVELRIIDKLHHQYASMTYAELQQKYETPLCYRNAVRLMMGRVFVLGSRTFDPQQDAFANLTSGATKSGHVVYWTAGAVGQRFDTDSTYRVQKTRLQRDKEEIYFVYSDWQAAAYPYPSSIKIVSQGATKASVNLTVQKMEFVTPDFEWQDLSNYKQITLEQLMNTYLK